MKFAGRASALALAAISCTAPGADSRKAAGRTQAAAADSMGALPTAVTTISSFGPPDLLENSALVSSRSQPGVLFTINDSGNEPVLFALDTTGAFRGRWKIREATNRDWEAASRGPCTRWTAADSVRASQSCLFIGDVGDNEAQKASLTVYQLAEPSVSGSAGDGMLPSHALHFRYPDGAHDVEAMYVGPQGTIYLITKRKLKDSAGKLRRALVFSIAPTAWRQRDTAVATLLDSLPIVVGTSFGRQITDASLSHDARFLAVRTYGQVFTFATDTVTGRVRNDVAPAVCNIRQAEGEPGEGVTWLRDRRELLLSREGENAPMVRMTCPLPTR
jgi:hypothetical protein